MKPKFLRGCYYHFSAAIWKKGREYGLTTKKYIKEATIFIFCLKMYPYIHNDLRSKYIENLFNFIKDKDKRFNKLMKYFLKNWRYNKSFNFLKISDENYIRRTNNIVESFHKTLNSQINHFHPKISFLANKLGFFASEAFKKI